MHKHTHSKQAVNKLHCPQSWAQTLASDIGAYPIGDSCQPTHKRAEATASALLATCTVWWRRLLTCARTNQT